MRLEMTLTDLEKFDKGPNSNELDCPTSTNGNLTQQQYQHLYLNHHQQQLYQPTNYYESLLLDKLHHMVPIMPQGRELSKLEIINYVIDYIRQLKEMVVDETP